MLPHTGAEVIALAVHISSRCITLELVPYYNKQNSIFQVAYHFVQMVGTTKSVKWTSTNKYPKR